MPRKLKQPLFLKEVDLCAAFLAEIERRDPDWVAYPETGGFDILLVRKGDGLQIGIEAKLRLTPEVVSQALPKWYWEYGTSGPDHRAVLVPQDGVQNFMSGIASHIGVTVIRFRGQEHAYSYRTFDPPLPKTGAFGHDDRHWFPFCPTRRLTLPHYVPDVAAGDTAPVKLTEWKIKAIRLCILLDERPVTRDDFKRLRLDPRRWVDKVGGWLVATDRGYVKGPQTPDLRLQHPVTWQQIVADRAKWDQGATDALV